MPRERRRVEDSVNMQHEGIIFHSWNLSACCYKKKLKDVLVSAWNLFVLHGTVYISNQILAVWEMCLGVSSKHWAKYCILTLLPESSFAFCCWFSLVDAVNHTGVIIYMFWRRSRVVECVSISYLNQDAVAFLSTTLQFELFGKLKEPLPNVVFQAACAFSTSIFSEYCTFSLDRCTAVLHHFVITSYFILCKMDLSNCCVIALTASLPLGEKKPGNWQNI